MERRLRRGIGKGLVEQWKAAEPDYKMIALE
jgi:hypothetical protein